jgi:hypothetical protein
MKTKRPLKDHALHLVRDLKLPPAGFNAGAIGLFA